MAFTVAFVPTGMNTGVSTAPWVSWSSPVRALLLGSRLSTVNIIGKSECAQVRAVLRASEPIARKATKASPAPARGGSRPFFARITATICST